MENQDPICFPFGEPLNVVQQTDRSPKKVFVLGAYASAVMAKWVDARGKEIVSALPVASEPTPFWNGDKADNILSQIEIPKEVGQLLPTTDPVYTPIGNTLDKLFLEPLGFKRSDAWLCDFIPEARIEENQRSLIEKFYKPIMDRFDLPKSTIPNFKKTEFDSMNRRYELLDELEESKAESIILLGDLPIAWFLRFMNKSFTKLSDFGTTEESYGQAHPVTINRKMYVVFPLCHPRQVDRLGVSNEDWKKLHDAWVARLTKAKATTTL